MHICLEVAMLSVDVAKPSRRLILLVAIASIAVLTFYIDACLTRMGESLVCQCVNVC